MQGVIHDRYDRTTITLHWLTAALVAALWLLGQTADDFPDGSVANTGLWSTRVPPGFALALALISRVVWRASGHRCRALRVSRECTSRLG